MQEQDIEDYNNRAFGIVKKVDGGASRMRFYMLRLPKSHYSDDEIRIGEFLNADEIENEINLYEAYCEKDTENALMVK